MIKIYSGNIFKFISLLMLTFFLSISHANDWNAQTHNIILGDFDGDGVDDILLQAKSTLYLNGLLKGDGNGKYSNNYQSWDQNHLGINWGSDASEISTGDFDGDKKIDLLIRSKSGGSHKILLADSAGKFTVVNFVLPNNHLGFDWSVNASNITIADFNNDNYADVFLQSKDKSKSSAIIASDSSGNLTITQQILAPNYLGLDWSATSHNITAGDFNGDGNADLFLQAVVTFVLIPMDGLVIPIPIIPTEGHVLLLADSNTGQFNTIAKQWQNSELSGLDLDNTNYRIYAADFDGDGSSELFLQSKNTGSNLHILKFNGTNSFTVSQTWSDTQLGANWSEASSNIYFGNIDTVSGIDVIVQPKNTSGQVQIAYSTSTGQLSTTTTVNLTNDTHQNKNYAVGKIPGKFSVTPSGQTSYDVPIVMPPGVAGMQPELSISYSSQGSNGVLGLGWGLNGLTAIHRCAKNIVQDGIVGSINIDSNDRFCLDGERLVLISGSYGANGSTYKTEKDSFSIVTAHGGNVTDGPAWFEVETKSGQIYEYGNTSDSIKKITSKTGVLAWNVSEIRDVKNNAVRYKYFNDIALGEQYIQAIEYTINTGIGSASLRRIEFNYEAQDRPDIIEGYVFGVKTKQTKRLESIVTKIGSTKIRSYNFTYEVDALNGKSRLKELNECDANNNCVLPTSFRWTTAVSGYLPKSSTNVLYNTTNLKESYVIDVDGDGLTDLVYPEGNWKIAFNGKGKCVSATICSQWLIIDTGIQTPATVTDGSVVRPIDYNHDGKMDLLIGEYVYNASNSYLGGYNYYVLLSKNNTYQHIVIDQLSVPGMGGTKNIVPKYFDIDNDGTEDFITGMKNTLIAPVGKWGFHRKVNGSYQYIESTIPSYNNNWTVSYFDYSFDLDYNANGKANIIFPNTDKGKWEIIYYNGSNLATITTNVPTVGYDKSPKLADVNGDGLQDILINDNNVIKLYINKGDGQFEASISTSIDATLFAAAVYVDYNLDGKADFLIPESGTVKLYQSTGRAFAKSDTGMADTGFYNGVRQGDFNGDGKPDLLIPEGSTWKVSLQKNGIPNLIDRITDGLSAETDITYQPLTNTSIYTKGSDINCANKYPVVCIGGAMQVVSQHSASNGIGGVAIYSYKYTDLRAHLRGRGALGFASMEILDQQTNLRVVTNYDNSTGVTITGKDPLGYADSYPYAGLAKLSTTYYLDPTTNTSVIVKKTVSDTFDKKITSAANTYYPFVQSNTEYSYSLKGQPLKTVNTVSQYDTYGNAVGITVTTTDTSNQPTNGEQYIKTTTNSYYNPSGDHSAYLRFGRVTLTKVVSQRIQSTQPQITSNNQTTRYSAFEYNSDLMLSAEIVEPFQPQYRVRTTYAYDSYGNKSLITTTGGTNSPFSYSANDPVYGSQAVVYPFDVKTTTIDHQKLDTLLPEITTSYSINNVQHKEIKTIDARFGVVKKTTGINGIPTSWDYDGFGRKKVENRIDGSSTTINYQWCTFDCPIDGVYSITTRTTGKPDVTNYTDILGREVRVKTTGFDGTVVLKDTEYNALGKISAVSAPYFSGAAIQWSQYKYDVLGRTITETSPDGAVNTVAYDGLVVTKTNNKQQTKTEIKNVTGKIVKVIDDFQNFNQYFYDVSANLVATIDAQNNVIRMYYDLLGRKTSMDDPDMGHWEYQYDALGKLRWQKDAKNQVLTSTYDALGRMVQRTSQEGISTWKYDRNVDNTSATGAIGKLVQVDSPNYRKVVRYDLLGRPLSTTETIDGVPYVQSITYDNSVSYTRKKSTNYPNGFSISYQYNASGFLESIKNTNTSEVYWRVTYINARGQTESEEHANGVITTSRGHDVQTGRLSDITSFTANTTLQLKSYQFDVLGNLDSRTDHILNNTETFTYDSLNRLQTATLNSNPAKTYTYDAIGNILNKPDVSTSDYVYGSNNGKTDGSRTRPHAVASIGSISYTYDLNGNMSSGDGRTLNYTSFNKPLSISKGGTVNSYFYDASYKRIKKVSVKSTGTTTTIYIGKGYEHITKSSNVIEEKYYINTGNSTVIFTKRSNNTSDTRYLLKDHLGSTDVIVDGSGNIVEALSFDAWGARRNSNWSATNNFGINITSLTTRGFTGHEQDDEIGLINMNARLYDPKIGRFITPDTVIQFPYSTQGLNRYTYVNNNPLSYTDPTGHSLRSLFRSVKKFFRKYGRVIVAAVASYFTFGLTAVYSGSYFVAGAASGYVSGGILSGTWSGKGAVKNALLGGVGAGFLYGIGALEAAKTLSKFQTAVAHGVVGGVRSVVQGGKFGNGFLSAVFGKTVTFATRGSNLTFEERYAVATVSGGVGSALGGGKFANGAVTASFGFLFNEATNSGRKKRDYYYRDKMKILKSAMVMRGSENPNRKTFFGNIFNSALDTLTTVKTGISYGRVTVYFEKMDKVIQIRQWYDYDTDQRLAAQEIGKERWVHDTNGPAVNGYKYLGNGVYSKSIGSLGGFVIDPSIFK